MDTLINKTQEKQTTTTTATTTTTTKRKENITISIIGTAGRDQAAAGQLNKELFDAMCNHACHVIRNEWKLKHSKERELTLVSGGSSWSDHVAVRLFLDSQYLDEYQLNISNLILHLPCEFVQDLQHPKFHDNGKSSWRDNPGGYLNRLHQSFSHSMRQSSLMDLLTAIKLGAQVTTSAGFHARNSHVAKSRYLLAFTWSETKEPSPGGTLDTWKKASFSLATTKLHVSLVSLTKKSSSSSSSYSSSSSISSSSSSSASSSSSSSSSLKAIG